VLQSNVRLDLLITDVGLQGHEWQADGWCSTTVLFFTGYAERAAIRRGDLEPGMHGLITPFVGDRAVSTASVSGATASRRIRPWRLSPTAADAS
jgi:hypothetical protein